LPGSISAVLVPCSATPFSNERETSERRDLGAPRSQGERVRGDFAEVDGSPCMILEQTAEGCTHWDGVGGRMRTELAAKRRQDSRAQVTRSIVPSPRPVHKQQSVDPLS
jgi:hypothetical protein